MAFDLWHLQGMLTHGVVCDHVPQGVEPMMAHRIDRGVGRASRALLPTIPGDSNTPPLTFASAETAQVPRSAGIRTGTCRRPLAQKPCSPFGLGRFRSGFGDSACSSMRHNPLV